MILDGFGRRNGNEDSSKRFQAEVESALPTEAQGFYRIKTRYRLSDRERAASERDRALAYPSTKRCGNERSRYLQYLKSVFGGEYKGDMTNVFIYLETGQLTKSEW